MWMSWASKRITSVCVCEGVIFDPKNYLAFFLVDPSLEKGKNHPILGAQASLSHSFKLVEPGGKVEIEIFSKAIQCTTDLEIGSVFNLYNLYTMTKYISLCNSSHNTCLCNACSEVSEEKIPQLSTLASLPLHSVFSSGPQWQSKLIAHCTETQSGDISILEPEMLRMFLHASCCWMPLMRDHACKMLSMLLWAPHPPWIKSCRVILW